MTGSGACSPSCSRSSSPAGSRSRGARRCGTRRSAPTSRSTVDRDGAVRPAGLPRGADGGRGRRRDPRGAAHAPHARPGRGLDARDAPAPRGGRADRGHRLGAAVVGVLAAMRHARGPVATRPRSRSCSRRRVPGRRLRRPVPGPLVPDRPQAHPATDQPLHARLIVASVVEIVVVAASGLLRRDRLRLPEPDPRDGRRWPRGSRSGWRPRRC